MLNRFLHWHWQTGCIVGQLVVFVFLIKAVQTGFFTSACKISGYYCEYSLGFDPNAGVANKMAQLESYLNDSLEPVYREEPPILNKRK